MLCELIVLGGRWTVHSRPTRPIGCLKPARPLTHGAHVDSRLVPLMSLIGPRLLTVVEPSVSYRTISPLLWWLDKNVPE